MLRPVSKLTRRPSPHLSRWFHASTQADLQALQQKAPPQVTTSNRKPKITQAKVESREAAKVKEDRSPVQHAKRNELGVQLLSRQLHSQIFKNVSFPPPDPSFVHIAREHLEMHGLDPTQGSILPDTGFTLPPLQGSNLLEHFYRIGSHAAQPWLRLAQSFVHTQLPPQPDHWEIQSGWTKYYYYPDGSSYSEHVPYPMHDGKPEELLTFDVETMPNYHPYAIMACAASPNGWYSWISPWLLGESKNTQHLISIGDPTVPRVIVGHNVSYDRGRILEEYNLKPTMNRFIDTMALHVAVKGISSHQRPAWMKYRKSKETQVEQEEEAVEAIVELMSAVEKRMMEEVDLVKKEELRRLYQDMEDSLPSLINKEELPSEAEVAVKRWEELTSANSLADVAKLHCNIDVNKDVRDDFMKLTPDEIRDNITEYLEYCASDVDVTHRVYVAALPEFFAGCPHPVSFAGIWTMGSSFLTVNDEWEFYIQRAEAVYREMEEGVKVKLKTLAEEAKLLMDDEEKWKDDTWLSQLDWTPKVAGKSRGVIPPELANMTANSDNSDQIEEAAAPAEDEVPPTPANMSSETTSVPAWYQEIQADPLGKKVLERTLPLLLKFSYDGHPLQYTYKERWHYLDGDEIQRIPTSGGKKTAQLFSSRHAGKLLLSGDMTSIDSDLALAISTGDKGDDIQSRVLQLAKSVCESGEQDDVWWKQLDWEMVTIGDVASKEVPATPKRKKPKPKPVKPPPVLWPKWYWELTKPKKGMPPGTLDITVRNRIAPLLFRLSWLGWPLYHSREHGWTFRVPANVQFQTRQTPLSFYDPADDALNELSTNGGFFFYKLPHKDGEKANVGSPLSKTFIKYAEDGTMKSPVGEAKEALDMNAQCSYWISARDRIMNQMVVWQNRKINLGFSMSKPIEGEKQKWGIILPQVITMGTVTRRAIEKTWLTASNAKKNRVGSELKAMVRAPEGYAIVGADVDSEELWISSCMGDAQFGLHGATAIGWMTLEGTKAAGTDLHSKTASILGISRDQAKIFNYSRIYGAGMRHAVLLLLQSNAGMLPDEAQKLAENLYASTKGKNTHRTDMFDRKFWFGGTESFVFNKLEEIALSDKPQTPALGCGVTYALSKEYLPAEFGSDYMPSRINWVVQSSGVDYLHLLIVSMEHLIAKYNINARYLISVHDELRYLVKEEDKYRAALALQIANLWTRSVFAYKLGMDDLPQGVAFFSAVDIDHVLRKEVDMPCVTPSQPVPIGRGESLDITGVLAKTNGGSLWKDGHPMSTDPPEEYIGSIEGYTLPDCLVHRAASAAFLRAQATSDFGEVKGLAQKASGKKFSGGIGSGRNGNKGKKSAHGKGKKLVPVGNGEGVDWTALVEKASYNTWWRAKLVRSTEDTKSLAEDEFYEFHPTFTYPIFGEDEKLYGYQGLEIDLRFASGSLTQYLNVKYTNKLDSTSTVDDVEGILSSLIPPGYFKDEKNFLAFVEEDASTFRPPGQLIYSYTRPVPSSPKEKGKAASRSQSLDPDSEDSVVFEVYHASPFLPVHDLMQIFILLYIEAGSYINEDEDSWEFVILYEKRKRRGAPNTATYHFVGYSSLYPFYFFPEKTPELYKAIYQYILSQPNIAELTVEDPAEAFEDLRDRNDLRMLLSNRRFMEEGFGSEAVTHGGGRAGGVGRAGKSGRGGKEAASTKGRMGPPSDKAWLEKWRNDLKIAGRQFHRLVEMLLLLRLDSTDARAEREYRIQVKERLYRFNFEILAQLEKEERLEKLEETFQSVKQDYLRILAMVP
ncbi:hypothetical protein C0995_013648 [Termitomyces sp. Mi166|nr:hypothetical protein C0995_013648 [Termitomyces sp. Mi166\